jgi:hypothetical protein
MNSNVHYINERDRQVNGRGIADTIREATKELKQFAETRLAMLQAEVKEKTDAIKAAAPMIVIGGLIAATSFLVLTGALIALLWRIIGDTPWAPFLAFAIVGVFYAIVGFGVLLYGYRAITEKGLIPERTINVLKQDKIWLENEVRSQL